MGVRLGLRLRCFFAASALIACEAHANPPGAATTIREQVGERRFEPAAIGFVVDSALDRARDALDRGDATAAKNLAEAAIADATALDVPRLHYVAARASLALRDEAAALGHFAALDRTPAHALTPYARLERATLLERSDANGARELASPLAALNFAGATQARRIEMRARVASGDRDGALPSLRRVASNASGESLADAAVPLIEYLEARGDEESIREALRVAHRLYVHAARTSAGRSATTTMRELASRLPRESRSLGVPTLEEEIARADALAAARSNDALEAYDAILAKLEQDDARRCELRFARLKQLERGRDKRGTLEEMLSLASDCEDPEIRGYSLFKVGRSRTQSGDAAGALEVYARFPVQAPRSRFADDAAVAAARIHLDRNEIEEMRAILAHAVDAYPEGDMRAEAYFLAAWSYRRAGDFEKALSLLSTSRARIPVEPGEENVGRAAYWEARTLAELSRLDDAANAYESLARSLPLSYYGMSALSRLAELDGDRAEMVRGATHGDGAALALVLPENLELQGLAYATELLTVGEIESAKSELTRIGLLRDDANDDAVLLVASLYEATDHPNTAVSLMRRRMVTHRAGASDGISRAALRLGYPRAFSPLVEEAAAATSVPASFVRAIAREESSFDPTAVSRANAYGLIQILVPTARGFSRDVGIEPSATNLKDPRTNLAFGTRFMARLFARFAANPGLVPAAYNAGHGAVERWLRADRNRAFDVFLEEIPYEETRRYTRRVLQSYGVYSLLDDGRVPTFLSSLPPDPNAAAAADAGTP